MSITERVCISLRVSCIILMLIIHFQNPVFSQICNAVVTVPDTVNGIVINSQSDGSVFTFPTAYTSCNQFATPDNATWLGSAGPFTYTLFFSSPVQSVTITLAATGQMIDEHFVFNTDAGIPDVNMLAGCFSTVTNNEIFSGLDSEAGSGGGGWFTISTPSGFTTLTITGEGGSAGSLFALCADGIVPHTTPDPCTVFSTAELPNVVTPNNDDVNDAWTLPDGYAACFPYECRFFNRWGQQVYFMTPDTAPFAGKDDSDQALSDGVYWYLLDSQAGSREGFVTITH